MDFDYNKPIYLQVAEDIKKQIVVGEIQVGSKLPSNAELAVRYQINPNTVQRIYKELESAGVCFTKRGIGTFVVQDDAIVYQMREAMENELIDAFLQGMQNLGIPFEETIKKMKSRRNYNA